MSPEYVEMKVERSNKSLEVGLGRARMDRASREALGLEYGDIIEIVGKKSIAAKVFKDEPSERGTIHIDGLMRSSAGVRIGDVVKVYKRDVVFAEEVNLAPNIGEGQVINFKDPNFVSKAHDGLQNRPLMTGDEIHVPNLFLGKPTSFFITHTVPQGVVTVSASTKLTISERANKPKENVVSEGITYDDIGGLGGELERIREIIELPLNHPEIFERMGINAPKGVLLFGPPGTGKTLIAKAVAKESGASFYSIQGPEIVSKHYGESEEKLRKVFDEANKNRPSVIFIDELDSIAPKRDEVTGEVERRIVAQLLTLMDGMSQMNGTIVIAATNREDSIDPALRRPGRFDREIEIGVPGKDGRNDILEIHLKSMPLAEDVDIPALASMTQGFVGADLAALAREGAMKCLGRHMHELDNRSSIPEHVLAQMKVTMKDFIDALSDIEPSGMREVVVDIPEVKWSDIGGLDDIKKEIAEVFVPEEEEKGFQRLGIKRPKGLLLFGPPGTGKTMIAKAIATESGANFIAVNGPEIASKWLGESEKTIRQIFKRAKQMAPCIIFFDEMDSIAPRRGSGGEAWEHIVDQILTSMDGMEKMSNVTVIAATNRPDMIDPAILRPGRIDKKVLIGAPNIDSRLQILKICSKDMPLKDVSLEKVALETDGYVGADLAELCREAGMNAYREDPNIEFISQRHFDAALLTVPPSVSKEELESYNNMDRSLRKRKSNYDRIPFYG